MKHIRRHLLCDWSVVVHQTDGGRYSGAVYKGTDFVFWVRGFKTLASLYRAAWNGIWKHIPQEVAK